MRKLFFIVPLVALGADGFLSNLKLQELNLSRQKALIEAKKLRDSWINPIQMSYLYQRGDQFPNQRFENFTISVDQPIFKSGGIYKAITYAAAKKRESLLGVRLSKKELIAQVLELLYKRKKLLFQIKKQQLLTKNARLDVLMKKEQYLSNTLDSTFLDNAILQKNRNELALLELKQSLAQLDERLKSLSDIDPNAISLPTFSLLPQKRFLHSNLALKRADAAIAGAKDFYGMSIARYLPQVSLQASYNYQKMRGSLYFPGYSYSDHFFVYGVRLSMPLFDINALKNIELAKIDLLKSKNSLAQLRREKRALFERIQRELALIAKKIELAKEDERLYAKLLEDTKERVEAGEKTLYDEEIMQNSLQTKRLDQKIYELDRQILLLQLYKELDDAKI